MEEARRIELIMEAIRYCQRVKAMGMPPSCYAKALREPVYFLWERRAATRLRAAKFCSKAAVGLRFGRGELVYDHAVPFNYLQKELLSLTDITPESVRDALERFTLCVLITKDENARLNAGGYGRSMPADWDRADVLARYKAVGIEVVENVR
jgi:hypothetical protein